tara:strand:+ start:53 stop:460 length:408 start_codon:yes stop_codon:yes gene_type:complete
MHYTINESFVEDFLNNTLRTPNLDKILKPAKKLSKRISHSQFEVKTLEDGKQEVTVNTIGHNPKDMTVDVTEETIIIKSTKEEGTSSFVEDIDLTLTVGNDYDGTKSTATFNSGLLTIVVDKKINKKAKSLKIQY